MSMNRKQRRLQDKKAGKKTGPAKPAAGKKSQDPARAAELKSQGMALKAAGKEAEAIPLLREALSLDSSLADVHFTLAMMARTKPELKVEMEGVNKIVSDKEALKLAYQKILYVLKKRKQYKEALVCQEELCLLFPEELDEKANLALVLNIAGQKENALRIMAELMEQAPDEQKYKAVFNGLAGPVLFQQHEPLIKKALQSCFDNIYETNLVRSFSLWVSLVLHDPACRGFRESELIVKEEDFITWMKKVSSEDLSFLQECFFLDGVRLLTLANPIEENFMVRMRRWLCLNAVSLATQNRLEFFEPFLCALGEQCFFNEYIYTPDIKEASFIAGLVSRLLKQEDTGLTPIQAYALVSCYEPLYKTFHDQEAVFRQLSKQSVAFSKLVKTQFFDPLEEERLKPSLKSFGILINEVSKNVRVQYEENPYPRWITVMKYPSPNDGIPIAEEHRNDPVTVLIAGCGTGRHAMNAVAAYPHGKVTAIDLSRSSLAYGQRKAREAGVADRIDFIHADILSMEKWPTQFDIVECSGVLHHMEDPFRGWQVLTNLLKSGGYFKVGLYSELARKQVVEAREYVSQHGFPSTLEGIRACRDSIMGFSTQHPMRQWLVGTADFYATSLIRDLIFHVQEHRMTIPQIQEMMERLGLTCKNFILSKTETAQAYDKMFPADLERNNMQNWHEFEQKFPDTFSGMYQFWCQKVN